MSRPGFLSFLGNALRKRFERLGADQDIEEALRVCRDALADTPADDPDRPGYLINLGSSLLARFTRSGALADVDAAIHADDEAVASAPPDSPHRVTFLIGLGNALSARYHRLGAPEDLDRAISVCGEAVALTRDGDVQRGICLNSLGATLQSRYRLAGEREALDAAIQAGQDAVAAVPARHHARAGYLSNLGNGLLARFERDGILDDLDKAIEASREAIAGLPPGSPDHAACSNNLGAALHRRYRRLGAGEDMEAAIAAGRDAVSAVPANHPARVGYLLNLSGTLERRSRDTATRADIDEAVSLLTDALDSTPAHHPNRAVALVNLGTVLQARYRQTAALEDLDAAIEAGREGVAAVPTADPSRGPYLNNVGIALLTRFQRAGAPEDLDAAIDICRAAADAMPADSAERATALYMLGRALTDRFTRAWVQDDLRRAASAFLDAANIDAAAPYWRVRAAWQCAQLFAGTEDTDQAADLTEFAIELLPEVASRLLSRHDQQDAIGNFAGIATAAAALALSASAGSESERAVRALRLLEAGRAVLLSQILEASDDLTNLRETHPDLAGRFAGLRDMVNQPTPPPGQTVMGRYQAAKELAALLEQIRSLDGFGYFGLPSPVDELSAQAAEGPIVTFNISRARSDALILTTGGVTLVSLPNLDHDTLIDQINAFYKACADAGDPDADRLAAQANLGEVLAWLWDAAAGPILHTLGYNQAPSDGHWPRIWWTSGSLLGLLPIHAAGYHSRLPDPAQRAVLDRVVSSYTPTIGALRYARRRAAAAGPRPAAQVPSMVVAMPTAPGLAGSLHQVAREVELVRDRFPDCTILIENEAASADSLPTKANVLARLPACVVAHFACHAYSAPEDPSQSRLLLRDHETDPLNVASIAAIPLDRARLAYLSACGTAISLHGNLLDEGIHLTSAFQLAGFPSVVGTLWEITDGTAVDVADSFYAHLETSPGTLDPSRAAFALHQAVRTIREEFPITPSLWSAYLHAGA